MAITRGIKDKLDKYGVNLPVDKRTRAYVNLLRKNQWSEAQYVRYLKDTLKRYTSKEKRFTKEVASNKITQQAIESNMERNKIRYTGSTLVKLLITEDKEIESIGQSSARLDTFQSRQKTTNKDVFIEFHTISFDKRVSGIKEINAIVKYQVQKLERKVSLRPYVIEVDVDAVKQSINKYTNVPMEKIRLKQSGSYNIDGYKNQDWDTQTDKCVFDYIIHTYGQMKGFKKKCNDYETLEKIFDNGDSIFTGVNTSGIRNWCEYFNIPMHALDDEERRFAHYVPKNRNQNAPAMIFRISDSHFYPVPENKRKSVLTINTQIDASSNVIYDFKKEEKENAPITNVVVLENTNPMFEISNSIISSQTKPTQISVLDGNIQSYKLNGTTYTINKFIPFIQAMCVNMKIDYTGQSLGNILNVIITETVKQIPKSHHNPNVFTSLVIAKKNRVHTGLIENSYAELINHENTVARDINKHYTSVMYEPLEEWIRFDFNDMWEDYDGTLKLGLYYIKTQDTTLFRKSDIYSSAIIKKALENNIELEIVYQLIPKYTEMKNMFRLVIDKILEYSKGDSNIYKLLINMMSGMLAKTKCTTGKYQINSNLDQIFSFIRKYPDMQPVIKNIPDTDHYLYGAEKDMVMTENNLGMYIQIIDQSNIKVYDMVKEMGGTLIARKVDCAIVHYDNMDIRPVLEESTEWGKNRSCAIPRIKYSQEIFYKTYDLKVKDWKDYNIQDSDDWEKIMDVLVEKDGLLLQADAGCGKTYVAKKMASILANVKKMAPTNKAALNLKGSTIHKFLNMDIEGNVSTKILNHIKKNVKYIFVDEISMITKELWRRLAFVKRATGVKFLLIGDDKQLEPVEDEKLKDYFNHPAVKYLCNNNRNILTVMKRFNPELKQHLNHVENVDIRKFPFKETQINIAYTHKTRKAVNKKWNDRLKPKNALYIPMIKDDDKHGQDMYVYTKLPLIARRNDNKNQMYFNNETFEVTGYDEAKIYLYTERPNDQGELEVHAIDIDIHEVQKLFYLNYCSTIHKVQGTTITECFTIWDWNHHCMNKKAKYTALSRGTCPEHISIVGTYNEDDCNDIKICHKLSGYARSDAEKGYENDLTVDKVKVLLAKQNSACNICNCDLKTFYAPNDPQQFSVDRIDSRLGHTCSNIQLLCWACNSAKGARF